jgi:hypothetical protein
MSPTAHPAPTTRVLNAIAGAQTLALPSGATGLITACPCSPPPPGAAPWLGGVALWQGRVIWVVDPVGLCRVPSETGERLIVVVEAGADAFGWGVAISAPAVLADAALIGGEIFAGCPSGWLRPALLGDGRRVWLADTAVISAALRHAEAA